MLKAMLFET